MPKWLGRIYLIFIQSAFPRTPKSEYFGFPDDSDMQPGLGTTVLKANYKE